MHPVQTVFLHLSHIVRHALPEAIHFEGKCSCCGRGAHEFDFEGYPGKDGYKVPYVNCAACESFNVGDINVLGIERGKVIHPDGSETGVSHKFGMLAGSGCLIDSAGKTVVFMPPGTYKKIPQSFLDKFTVIPCTTGQQITHINKMDLIFPVIYIQDFGKKTKSLIRGLRYSSSRSQIVVCTDEGNSSTNEAQNTFNLDALVEIATIRNSLKNTLWAEFRKQVYSLCFGSQTPLDFTAYMQKQNHDGLLAIYRLLPIDPHQRMAWLRLVDKVSE